MKFTIIFLLLGLSANAQQPMKFKLKGEQSLGAQPVQSSSKLQSEIQRRSLKNDALSSTNYFPATGVKALTLSPAYSVLNSSLEVGNANSSTEITGSATKISFKTRLNASTALEAYSDFGSQTVSMSSKIKGSTTTTKENYRKSGLGDIHLKLDRLAERGSGNLFYGVDLGLSPTTSEEGSQRSDGNRFSGGTSLAPYFSYEQIYQNRVVGIKTDLVFFYDRSVEKRTTGRTLKYVVSGGEQINLTAFNEWKMNKNLVGLSGALSFVNEGTFESSGVRPIELDPSQFLNLSLYGENRIQENFVLLPSLNFRTVVGGASNFESYDEVNLGLAARIAM
jgi:hypothetical protein